MKLLLDSHAFLWFVGGNSSLSATARVAIEEPSNQKFVSHATAWEAAIKISLGKLALAVPFEEVFPGAIVANGFQELSTSFSHFQQLIALPMHHRDPFDRLLIAQAIVDGMTLVSCDSDIARYGVPILW